MTKFGGVAFSGIGDAAYLAKASQFEAFLTGNIEVIVVTDASLTSNADVNAFEALVKDAALRV
jgi:methylaspartate ammonia-lyase